NIPDFWKQGLAEVEPIDFKYTTISLNDAYELSFKHALQMIKRNGGKVSDDEVIIELQEPKTVPLEVAFEGHYPNKRINLDKVITGETAFQFEGIGFAVNGSARKKGEADYTFNVEMYIDGNRVETAKLPTNFNQRRFTPFWRYQLPMANHEVRLKVLNPTDMAELHLDNVIVYGNQPFKAKY
ncbi:MAG: ADP-ribosylglycohydrolase family protein, partial [bacterium]